jgi:putative DNA primase/helicase
MITSRPEPGQQLVDHLADLKALDQWVLWRSFPGDDGKVNKIPDTPTTFRAIGFSWSKPENWLSYQEASRIAKSTERVDGIGFVPTEDDPYSFPDIDKVIDSETGELLKP